MSELDPVMEAAVLKETEDALREFCRAANNCGLKRMQIAMMLRRLADDYGAIEIETPSRLQ